MRGPAIVGCSALALALLELGSPPAAACPWNGCGTDAHNAARAYDYDYDLPPADAYGYAPAGYYGPTAGYYAPRLGYAPPVYGYTYVQPYAAGYYARQRRYARPLYGR